MCEKVKNFFSNLNQKLKQIFVSLKNKINNIKPETVHEKIINLENTLNDYTTVLKTLDSELMKPLTEKITILLNEIKDLKNKVNENQYISSLLFELENLQGLDKKFQNIKKDIKKIL